MKLTGTYTQAGARIAAGLLAGETLTVTRIAAGSGSTPLSAAALEQERQELGLCQPQVEGTCAVLRCTLSSQDAAEAYTFTELGVYARDCTGDSVLYQIFRLDEPVSVDPAVRLVLRFNLEQTLSDGGRVEVTAPLNGLILQKELLTKADLVGGQVPYAQTPHLTSNVTLYVNAFTGSDSNPGTQQAPFKTIQAAVDALPKDLGESRATINIAAGTYEEDVLIQGFYRGGSILDLWNNSIGLDITGTGEDTVVRSITFSNNLIPCIRCKTLEISGGVDRGGNSAPGTSGVIVKNCTFVELNNISVSGCANGVVVGNYAVSGGTTAWLSSCTISSATTTALYCLGSNTVFANLLGGSGNAVGITVQSGARVTTLNSSLQATTAQSIYAGFITGF